MRGYIARRVLQGIVTIWLVTLGVFSVLRLTGDPVSYMLPRCFQGGPRPSHRAVRV